MRNCSRSLIMVMDGIVTTMVAAEPVGPQVVELTVDLRDATTLSTPLACPPDPR
jgi:hypothetical protein